MAVNRVVLQHFSMNLDYMVQERPNIYGPTAPTETIGGKLEAVRIADDGYADKMFGLSPPSESKLVQRRLKARGSCQLESKIVAANQGIAVASPSG